MKAIITVTHLLFYSTFVYAQSDGNITRRALIETTIEPMLPASRSQLRIKDYSIHVVSFKNGITDTLTITQGDTSMPWTRLLTPRPANDTLKFDVGVPSRLYTENDSLQFIPEVTYYWQSGSLMALHEGKAIANAVSAPYELIVTSDKPRLPVYCFTGLEYDNLDKRMLRRHNSILPVGIFLGYTDTRHNLPEAHHYKIIVVDGDRMLLLPFQPNWANPSKTYSVSPTRDPFVPIPQ